MIRTLTLALAGALALACAPASAHEAVDVYLASLGEQPTRPASRSGRSETTSISVVW